MDPSNVNNIYALAAVCVMTLGGFFGGIAYTRKGDKTETTTTTHTTPASNGNGNGKYASKEYVDLRVSQHEIHCSQAEDIKKTLARLESKIDGLYEQRVGR